MRPLPEAVQRAFPCAPDRLPERPWHTDMTPAKAAAHDAAYPLPHPGYRAGQVWAAEDGDSLLVLWVQDGEPVGANEDYLRHKPHRYPYLMADPACPHLAPWSPAQEKP